MITRLTLAVVLVVGSTAPAWAQVVNSNNSGYHHASTAAEGAARGAADLVRSAGAANLLNSQPLENYEEARSRNLDNRLKATDAYFAMRARNTEARKAERGPRPTSEQLFRINQTKMPADLSPGELDPLTGQINWPVVFRDSKFDVNRKRMEAMVAYWAQHKGTLTSQQYQEVVKVGNELKSTLVGMVRNVKPREYIAAKTFLRSMLHSIRTAT